MRYRLVAAIATLAFVIATVACTRVESTDKVFSNGGLSIVSVLYSYGTPNGRSSTRDLKVKLYGFSADEEGMSNQLFPEEHPCASTSYRLQDFRPLADGTVLALFYEGQSDCGGAQLAKLFVKNFSVRVQRIDIAKAIDGKSPVQGWRAGADDAYFREIHPRVGVPSSPADRMVFEKKPSSHWVLVPLAQIDSQGNKIFTNIQTVAIDLRDMSLRALGDGDVIRFADGDATVLMSYEALSSAEPHFEYKAVRVSDASVIERVALPLKCYSIVSQTTLNALERDLNEAKSSAPKERDRAESNYTDTAALNPTLDDLAQMGIADHQAFKALVAKLELDRDEARAADIAIQATHLELVAKGANLQKAVQRLHDQAVLRELAKQANAVQWNAQAKRLDVRASNEVARNLCDASQS